METRIIPNNYSMYELHVWLESHQQQAYVSNYRVNETEKCIDLIFEGTLGLEGRLICLGGLWELLGTTTDDLDQLEGLVVEFEESMKRYTIFMVTMVACLTLFSILFVFSVYFSKLPDPNHVALSWWPYVKGV